HVRNPYPDGQLPWQVYHTTRNAVVRTCRRHGATGPLGERPLSLDYLNSAEAWEPGDDKPIYWIVDDQYNHEMYLYMEFEAVSAFCEEWLIDITTTLAEFPGWGIGVDSLTSGYILIFADRLLVSGPGFKRCRDAVSVINAAKSQIRENPAL